MKEIFLELIIGAIIEDDIWKKCFQHNFRKSLEKEETCDFSLLVCGGGGANQLGQSPNFFRNTFGYGSSKLGHKIHQIAQVYNIMIKKISLPT